MARKQESPAVAVALSHWWCWQCHHHGIATPAKLRSLELSRCRDGQLHRIGRHAIGSCPWCPRADEPTSRGAPPEALYPPSLPLPGVLEPPAASRERHADLKPCGRCRKPRKLRASRCADCQILDAQDARIRRREQREAVTMAVIAHLGDRSLCGALDQLGQDEAELVLSLADNDMEAVRAAACFAFGREISARAVREWLGVAETRGRPRLSVSAIEAQQLERAMRRHGSLGATARALGVAESWLRRRVSAAGMGGGAPR